MTDGTQPLTRAAFQAKIAAFLSESKVTMDDIAEICRVSVGTVGRWHRGVSAPMVNTREVAIEYIERLIERRASTQA